MSPLQKIVDDYITDACNKQVKAPWLPYVFEGIAGRVERAMTERGDNSLRPLFLCPRLRHLLVGPLSAEDLNDVLGLSCEVPDSFLEDINQGKVPEHLHFDLTCYRMLRAS